MARRNFQWRRLARRRKSNEGGLSRDQTSLYAKIDIFFPVHAKGDYVGAQSETNVKLPARESFRSLAAIPISFIPEITFGFNEE